MKTKPWPHQAKELIDHWGAPARAMLWQQRSGKSKVIIDELCLWARRKGLRSAIIVAPNGVHLNWARREIPAHWWDDVAVSVSTWAPVRTVGKQRELDQLVKTEGLAVLCVAKNSIRTPAVKKFAKRLLRRGPTALIVDESHHFGSPGAKMTISARALAKHCAMRRILTGTPVGNSPLRMFSQFELLSPGALGYSRAEYFNDRYAVYAGRREGRNFFKQVVGYDHLDELRERVAAWATVILRDDCVGLPPLIMSRQAYEPSPTQLKAYNTLCDQYIAEIDTRGTLEAMDAGPRLVRLQQLLSNIAVTDRGTIPVDLEGNPRVAALLESIERPAVVWCRFIDSVHQVKAALEASGLFVVEHHGGVNLEKRAEAIDLFQLEIADVFLATPGSAGEGLTLSSANSVIWYEHTFDVIQRDQANERATLRGGKPVPVVDLVAPGTVDDYILENLENKRDIAQYLTGEDLKRLIEEIRYGQ